jgi:hypothetical protein
MTMFTVLAPKAVAGKPADLSTMVFVKEGFCWPALFFPEIWMIFRKLWLVLVLDLVAVVAIAFLAANIDGPLPFLVLLLYRLWFALEANNFRRWTLEWRGFRLVGVVEGRDRDEAELRFFANWTPPLPAPETPEPPAASPPAPWKPKPESGEVVGLFPAPGGSS